MEQYKEDTESSIELDIEDKKPSYMALKQDECNATVEVTKTEELQKVLAQIEALMSREESQTLSKKK